MCCSTRDRDRERERERERDKQREGEERETACNAVHENAAILVGGLLSNEDIVQGKVRDGNRHTSTVMQTNTYSRTMQPPDEYGRKQ